MKIQNLLSHCFSTTTGTTFHIRQIHTVGVLVWLLVLQSVWSPRAGVLAEIEVQCFDCNWQSSSSHQNSEEMQDFCLPEHFQRNKVKTVSCSQGCMTTSMYENDPDGPVTTLELRTSSVGSDEANAADATTSSRTMRPPMSFFTRGCPNGDSTRSFSGCEEKKYQHVVREECFCTTPLCNASPFRARMLLAPMQVIMLVVILSGAGGCLLGT